MILKMKRNYLRKQWRFILSKKHGLCSLRGRKGSFTDYVEKIRGGGGDLPVYYRRGPSLIPRQSKWDLWWTKWQWDRFVSQHVCFPMSVALHQCPMLRLILLCSGGQVGKTWEPSNKPMFFRMSEEHCAPCSLHFHPVKYLRVSSPHDGSGPSHTKLLCTSDQI